MWLSNDQMQAQTVDILAADQIVRDPAITDAQRLLGNVLLGHKDGVLRCDSAWRFDDGVVEVCLAMSRWNTLPRPCSWPTTSG